MKKLSLMAALTLSTMLSACGGGGGGHGYIPPSTLPDNPDQPIVSCTGVTCMTNEGLSNSAKREELYNAATGGKTRMKMFARSGGNPIDVAFTEMKTQLIDNSIDENDAESLRPYLILAGFENLPEKEADLKDWIANRKYMIKRHAEKALKMYGTEKNVYLDNAKLHLVDGGVDQDSFINFTVDQNNRSGNAPTITGIEIAESDFGAEAISSTLTSTGETEFKGNDKLHIYNFYYAGKDDPRRLYIEISGYDENGNDKNGNKLSLDFIKEKLQLKLRERAEENKITCDNAPDKCDTMLRDNLTTISDNIAKLQETDLRNPDIFSHELTDRTIIMNYESYAQKIGGIEGNNLLFSDFGLVKWDETRTNTEDETDKEEIHANRVFAGGYDALKVTPDKNQTMHFEGDAVAGVNYKQITTGDDLVDGSSSTLLLNGKANLDFNQGNETLTANFNNWYDVNVTKNLDGSNSIKFSNGDKKDFGVGIEGSATKNDFKFKGFESNKFDNDLGASNAEYKAEGYDTYEHKNFIKENWDANSEGYTGAMDIGYYGKDGTPSEATGYVMYHTESKNNPAAGSTNNLVDVLEMQLGVGMQRK